MKLISLLLTFWLAVQQIRKRMRYHWSATILTMSTSVNYPQEIFLVMRNQIGTNGYHRTYCHTGLSVICCIIYNTIFHVPDSAIYFKIPWRFLLQTILPLRHTWSNVIVFFNHSRPSLWKNEVGSHTLRFCSMEIEKHAKFCQMSKVFAYNLKECSVFCHWCCW